MRALKEQSLLKLIKGKRLSEALTFCQSNQAYSDVCFNSVDMIKAIIAECIGFEAQRLLEDRQDLETTEQWLAFADGISKGFSFKYGMVYDEEAQLREPITTPYYDISLDEGEFALEFYIEGLLPEPGSNLMFARIYGVERKEGANRTIVEEGRAFISQDVHPNPGVVLKWLAQNIMRQIVNRDLSEIIISSIGHDDEDGEIEMRIDARGYTWREIEGQIVQIFELTNALEALNEQRNVVSINVNLLTGKSLHFDIMIDYLRF